MKKAPVAAGNIIEKARPESQDGFHWQVGIAFNDKGSQVFADLTGRIAAENLRLRPQDPGRNGISNGRMAIVLDGKLVSAPGLAKDEAITGGGASIGADNQAKAAELANVLNNPLEFPLELQDVQTVGPSLAKDAQIKSVTAAAVGVGLVVLFMVAFYLSAGVISIVAVFVNLTMIIGVMAAMEPRSRFPASPRSVLTVGMAVDANILVFERIRDEMKGGKTMRGALDRGLRPRVADDPGREHHHAAHRRHPHLDGHGSDCAASASRSASASSRRSSPRSSPRARCRNSP